MVVVMCGCVANELVDAVVWRCVGCDRRCARILRRWLCVHANVFSAGGGRGVCADVLLVDAGVQVVCMLLFVV